MSIPQSIETYLNDHAVPFQTVVHPAAYTAQEEAAVSHVPGRMWAKTVVCYAGDEPILAVLPADLTVDEERLRTLVGTKTLRVADEGDFELLYPECERGAMPPLGPLFGQRVFVDETLTADREIVFNAGTHRDAVRMRYDDFARLVRPSTGHFGRK